VENIFAGHTNSYHGFTFEQALAGISAAGFKYAELTAVKGWTEHLTSDMTDAQLLEAKALMSKYGIEGIALSGHCDLFNEQRLDDFRRNIELASMMGCKFIVSSTGEAHFGKEEGTNDDILIDNIKTLVPLLQNLDITMVLELHGLYAKGEDMARITRAVGSPYVGVNYDTANVQFYSGLSCIDDIKTCIDQVKYVHLKDSMGGKGVWNFPGTGNGKLPLKEFMEYMDANNYTGPYAIEIEYTEDYCMRDKDQPGDIDIANKEMADAWKYLHSLGRV